MIKSHRFRTAAIVSMVGTGVLTLTNYLFVYWSSADDIHYADRLVALFIAVFMCALALFLVAQVAVELRRVKAAYVRFPIAALSAASATFLVPIAQLAPVITARLFCGDAIETCRFVLGPIFVSLMRI